MEINKLCIGIDPGVTGAIAIIAHTNEGKTVDVHKMPETEKDVSMAIKSIAELSKSSKKTVCILEKVHAFPTAIPDKTPRHKDLVKYTKAIANRNKDIRLLEVSKKMENYRIVKRGAKATWTFGQNYGFLRGCLVSHGIAFEEYLPKAWQKIVGFGGTSTYSSNKSLLREKAQQLFPDVKIIQQTADSLLIAHAADRIIQR